MLLRSPIQPISRPVSARPRLPSILQQALSILRRPGIEAHLFLPGIGNISGLQAANYLDSALTTPATVDNPVGGAVDAIGVINATQPTTAAKPILRQTAGKYSWAFDGNDSLALGSVPFQASDNYCVIASGKTDNFTVPSQTLFGCSNNTSVNPLVGQISLRATGAQAAVRDDAGVLITSEHPSAIAVRETCVVTISRTTGFIVARKNGVAATPISTASVGATTLTNATIGASIRSTTANPLTGSTGPIIAIKGTLTDSEMLTLERFVAQLTPNAPSF